MILVDDHGGAAERTRDRATGDLRARIARALGWTEQEASSFSLQSLREMVRPVDPGLVREIDDEIRSGRYVYGAARESGTGGARNRAGAGGSRRSRYAIRPTDRRQRPGSSYAKVYGVERRLSTWELVDLATGAVVDEYQTRGDAQGVLSRVRAGRLDPRSAADRRLIESIGRAARVEPAGRVASADGDRAAPLEPGQAGEVHQIWAATGMGREPLRRWSGDYVFV